MAEPNAKQLANALQELEALAATRPAMREPSQTLAAILPVLFGGISAEKPLEMNEEEVRARLAAGVPLLRERPLGIDRPSLLVRWQGVCTALKKSGGEQLAEAVRRNAMDPLGLILEVLAGRPQAVALQVEAIHLGAPLVGTVLRFVALPALVKLAAPFQPLPPGAVWEQGYCPICGSWPLLGETRGLAQDRFLRCGWCAAAWPFDRLHCPFCDNRDHQTLGYLHAEGEEDKYRAATCELCHGHVKWVSTLFPLSSPQLLVADLATLHLDLAATEGVTE